MTQSIKISSRATREFWEVEVLYEDADLLALDKPAGLPTTPEPDEPEGPNLMRLLHDGIAAGAPWAASRGLGHLANPHRLDAEIGGVLVLAKNKAALIQLANQFGSERTVRTYTALVEGSPAETEFRVEARLGPHPTRPGTMRVDTRQGKRAVTEFTVRERFAGYTLLRCHPLTERPHQIRVHLRSRGLFVAGDEPYGGRPLLLSRLKPGYRFKRDREELPLIGQVALHAEELTLAHPVTAEPLTIRSPWPKHLNVALKFLRRYAPAPAVSAPLPPDAGENPVPGAD